MNQLVDIQDFYGLKPFKRNCHYCGKTISVEIPYESGGIKGFSSKLCDCGKQKIPYFVGIDDRVDYFDIHPLGIH